MSKRDSHPGTNESPTLTGMGEVTEPGPPPEATPQYVRPSAQASSQASSATDPDADLAASLLHDLARTSLPTNGIPETSGHNAAAYAVSARRPPRAMEDVTFEPAVVVNMTEPFPLAVTPLPITTSRSEPTLVDPRRAVVTDPNDPRGRQTMPAMRAAPPGPPRALQKTVLGARAQRRQVLLGIMSVIGIATLVAIGILTFAPRVRRNAASTPATSELTAASTDGVTVVTSTALPAPLEPPPPPPVTAAVVSAPPPPPPPVVMAAPVPPRATARVAGSSRPAAPPKAAAPKPAGTFEEPDRTF